MSNLKYTLLACAISLGMSSGANAQQSSNKPFITSPQEAMRYISPEDLQKYKDIANRAKDVSEQAPKSDLGKEAATTGQYLRERSLQIADQAMQKDRDDLMRFLGLDPSSSSSLFFFVSTEMPEEMLRAYAIEAMWSGGTLVFRGSPEDKPLMDFITKDLLRILPGKIDTGSISIDPRLYDTFNVQAVPKIVFTVDTESINCSGDEFKYVNANGKSLKYQKCQPPDPSTYVSISGAVTTDYALRSFIGAGFAQAQYNLDALAKGLSSGVRLGNKEQTPFKGQWESFVTPEEIRAANSSKDNLFRSIEKNSQELVDPSIPDNN